MVYEREHRLDDRALARLPDELEFPAIELDVPGKQTRAALGDQIAAMYVAPKRPGSDVNPGRRAAVAPKPAFHDFQALALRDVLSRLDHRRELRDAILAAADPRVAARVASDPNGGSGSPDRSHASPGGLGLWRAAERRAVTLYRRATAAGFAAPETRPVAEAIGAIGSGVPLPADVRRTLEAVLKVSLESVRIHTGSVARDAASAVCAEAFTVGEDIFFPAYDPASTRCQETLAHEVVHCIQWRQGRIRPAADGTQVSRPDDPLEREAEHQAKSIVAQAFHVPQAREAEPPAKSIRAQAHLASVERTRSPEAPNAGRNATAGQAATQLRTVPRTLVATPVVEPSRARGGKRSATGGSATTDNEEIGDGSAARVVTNLRGTVRSGPGTSGTNRHATTSLLMRRPTIPNQAPEDRPLEVSAWDTGRRLEDLRQSILQAPSHIMEVGGEYATLLAEHWHWIALGIGAAFGVEAVIEFSPSPAAIAARAIKLLASGTGLALIAVSIKSHAEQWAHLAWTALGDEDQIAEASRELVRLVATVVSIACIKLGAVARAVLRLLWAAFRRIATRTRSKPTGSAMLAIEEAGASRAGASSGRDIEAVWSEERGLSGAVAGGAETPSTALTLSQRALGPSTRTGTVAAPSYFAAENSSGGNSGRASPPSADRGQRSATSREPDVYDAQRKLHQCFASYYASPTPAERTRLFHRVHQVLTDELGISDATWKHLQGLSQAKLATLVNTREFLRGISSKDPTLRHHMDLIAKAYGTSDAFSSAECEYYVRQADDVSRLDEVTDLVRFDRGQGNRGEMFRGHLKGEEVLVKLRKSGPGYGFVGGSLQKTKSLQSYSGPLWSRRVRALDPKLHIYRDVPAMELVPDGYSIKALQDMSKHGNALPFRVTSKHVEALESLDRRIKKDAGHLQDVHAGNVLLTPDPKRLVVLVDIMVLHGTAGIDGEVGDLSDLLPAVTALKKYRW